MGGAAAVTVQRRPARAISVTASSETEPSDGHMPAGGRPNTWVCRSTARRIWSAASSG